MITANVERRENLKTLPQLKDSPDILDHNIESIAATLAPYIPSIKKREAILEKGFPLIPYAILNFRCIQLHPIQIQAEAKMK